MTRWAAAGRVLIDDDRPRVMGIVNVTPDSFSDGGRDVTAAAALASALGMADDGADLLDVGGESSRPGALPVSAEEELRRAIPAIEAIRAGCPLPISIDTTKAEVAARAIAAGAEVVNDITAMRGDPGMARVVADSGAAVVLMHMAGTPRTMQVDPRYDDVVTEVYDDLARQVERAVALGIPRERIAVDPGIGFGKTFEHNLLLLRSLARFVNLGCVVLVGTSRKGFLGTITGRPVGGRAAASVASCLWACEQGARVVRVHDVAPTVDAIRVRGALGDWGRQP